MFSRLWRRIKRKKEILFFLESFFLTIFLFFVVKYFWTASTVNQGEQQLPTGEAARASENLPESNNIPPVFNVQTPTTDLVAHATDSVIHDSFATFYDTFTFDNNKDQSKTNFYQDKVANAIFFPPDYKWLTATAVEAKQGMLNFPSVSFNNFMGPYSDRRCIHSNCLEQKGNDLYYNNKLLPLPSNINSSDLAAVSIASLGQRWLIGFTLKDGENYRGEVYYFNGRDFTALNFPDKINSRYFGLFGFGGESTDFLVIYGAYQGQAYRVQGTNFAKLDKFFDIRVMDDGFKAEVIKTTLGNNVNWYVYSTTFGRPHLIKLWQNRTSEIVGESVFNIFSTSGQGAAFRLLANTKNSISLLAKIDNSPDTEWKKFVDYGFSNNFIGTWTSIPIIRYKNSKITINRIAESVVKIDRPSESAIRLFFSVDEQNWQDIGGLKDVNFSTPQITNYFLKLTFPAQSDKFYSPYIESLVFDFYCDENRQPGD